MSTRHDIRKFLMSIWEVLKSFKCGGKLLTAHPLFDVRDLVTWGSTIFMTEWKLQSVRKVLMIVVCNPECWRKLFLLLLALIVCMGYGVVKHTLGKTMIYRIVSSCGTVCLRSTRSLMSPFRELRSTRRRRQCASQWRIMRAPRGP